MLNKALYSALLLIMTNAVVFLILMIFWYLFVLIVGEMELATLLVTTEFLDNPGIIDEVISILFNAAAAVSILSVVAGVLWIVATAVVYLDGPGQASTQLQWIWLTTLVVSSIINASLMWYLLVYSGDALPQTIVMGLYITFLVLYPLIFHLSTAISTPSIASIAVPGAFRFTIYR